MVARCAFLVISVLSAACGDDAPASDDGSGSGGSSSSRGSSDEDSTTIDPDTSASSSGDSTTGAEVPTGTARVLVVERTSDDDLRLPTIRDYAEGTLTDPIPLAHEVPDTVGIGATRITIAGTIASYCALPIDESGAQCFARDAAGTPLGAPQPFSVDPIAAPIVLADLMWVAGAGGYVLEVLDATDDLSIYFTALDDGQLQSPRVIAQASADERILPLNESIAPDGRTLAYQTADASDTRVWWWVSTVDAAPVSVPLVPAPPAGADSPAGLHWAADSRTITYRQELLDDPDGDELYVVDLSSGTPSAPMRFDDPQYGRPGPQQIAPDSHALVYTFVDDADGGGVMFVALTDGVPQSPVVIDDRLSEATWSPDSRWLLHVVSDDDDVQLFPASGDEPGPPIAVGDAAPGLVMRAALFTTDPRWLYVLAESGGATAELYRVEVSTDELGELQQVSAPLGEGARLDGIPVDSPDHAWLVYAVVQGAGNELWLVDVGGDEPGTPTRIAAATDSEARLRGFSPDSTMLTYEMFAGHGEPEPYFLVDTTAPDVSIALSDDASGVLFVTP